MRTKQGGSPGTCRFEQRQACTPPAMTCAKGVKHLPVRVPAIKHCAGDAGCRVFLSTGEAEPSAAPTHAGPSRVPAPPLIRRPTSIPDGERAGPKERVRVRWIERSNIH